MENNELSINQFTPKSPLSALCFKNLVLNKDSEYGETRHISLKFKKNSLHFYPGQSIGVLPPGLNKNGRNLSPRLYSIASVLKPIDEIYDSLELCVRRLCYKDDQGELVYGLASNYLCDLSISQEVKLCGPIGRHFILNNEFDSAQTHYVLMATGTGIAPFRAFIESWIFRISKDKESLKLMPKIWIILGIRDKDHLLYKSEFQDWAQTFKDKIRFDFVCSRTGNKEDSTKRTYISTFVNEHLDEFWNIINNPNGKAFLCGIKGMEVGIDRCMDYIAANRGLDWDSIKTELIKNKRWVQEVY